MLLPPLKLRDLWELAQKEAQLQVRFRWSSTGPVMPCFLDRRWQSEWVLTHAEHATQRNSRPFGTEGPTWTRQCTHLATTAPFILQTLKTRRQCTMYGGLCVGEMQQASVLAGPAPSFMKRSASAAMHLGTETVLVFSVHHVVLVLLEQQ